MLGQSHPTRSTNLDSSVLSKNVARQSLNQVQITIKSVLFKKKKNIMIELTIYACMYLFFETGFPCGPPGLDLQARVILPLQLPE